MTNKEAIKRIQGKVCMDEEIGCTEGHFPSCLTDKSVCEYALAIKALTEKEEADLKDEWNCPHCGNRYKIYCEGCDYCLNCGQKMTEKGEENERID